MLQFLRGGLFADLKTIVACRATRGKLSHTEWFAAIILIEIRSHWNASPIALLITISSNRWNEHYKYQMFPVINPLCKRGPKSNLTLGEPCSMSTIGQTWLERVHRYMDSLPYATNIERWPKARNDAPHTSVRSYQGTAVPRNCCTKELLGLLGGNCLMRYSSLHWL